MESPWRGSPSFEGEAGASAFVDAITLIALTGCRRSEIAQLRWGEVDIEAGLLRLQHSKTGPRAVPLGDQAIGLIVELKRRRRASGFFLRAGEGDQ